MGQAGAGQLMKSWRTLLEAGPVAAMTDAMLLERFAARRDAAGEAAFAALVARHGPMVRRLCRRWLGDPHDADDAFQATFLVLSRRAGSIRHPERLASWLYGTAHRTSRKLEAQSSSRRRHEAGAARSNRCPATTRAGSRRSRSSSMRWPACPKRGGRPWCSASWRAVRRPRRPARSAAPTGPSAAVDPGQRTAPRPPHTAGAGPLGGAPGLGVRGRSGLGGRSRHHGGRDRPCGPRVRGRQARGRDGPGFGSPPCGRDHHDHALDQDQGDRGRRGLSC